MLNTPAEPECADAPYDFGAFVAQRHHMSTKDAERLVELWLTHYRPRTQWPIYSSREQNHDSAGLDVYA
jgi:hypothetical protein